MKSCFRGYLIAIVTTISLLAPQAESATGMDMLLEENAGEGIDQVVSGFEFSGSVTSVIQATAGANSDSEPLAEDQTDASYLLDVEMVYNHNEKYYLVVVLQSGEGEGTNNNLNSAMAFNYDPYPTVTEEKHQHLELSQVYVEGLFLNKNLVVNIGKMDVHALYDGNAFAADQTVNFISGALVRSVGTVGYELEDYYSPALRVLVTPFDWLEAQAIYSHSGWDDLSDNQFWVFELNLKPQIGDLEGNYRIYTTIDARDYKNSNGGMENDVVYGVSIDQYITESMGIFFRWSEHGDDLVANDVVAIYSGGITIAPSFLGRPDDLFGVGYAELKMNDRLSGYMKEGQTVWEVYYNARINQMIAITPDIQFHSDLPREKDRSILVYGIRAQVNF